MKLIVDSGISALLVLGDWVYYTSWVEEEPRLNRIRVGGADAQPVSSLSVDYINYCEGWIVFSNPGDGGCLHKMRLDGSEPTKLADIETSHLDVVGSSIYFLDEESSMHTVCVDGSGLRLFPDTK